MKLLIIGLCRAEGEVSSRVVVAGNSVSAFH